MNMPVIKNFCLAGAICLGTYLDVRGASAGTNLNQPCPVEWRATPLIDAIQDLAKRLDVPYVLDSSVTVDMLRQPVRMVATKLSGRQAFRWTVRSAGLDAVLVNGAMMIAVPERIPLTWRAMGSGGSVGDTSLPAHLSLAGAGKTEREAIAAEARRADLAWVDAPLSRVARDISEKFGLDVVFHPAIQADEPLVRLEGVGLNLQAVRQAFAEQIRATSRYDDGAIWVEVSGVTASRMALEQPKTASAPELALPQPALLDRIAPIDVRTGGWEAIKRVFSLTGAVDCRIEASAGSEPPILAAQGTVFGVLEGMRLLEGWKWRLETVRPGGRPALIISVPDPVKIPGQKNI